MQLVAANMPCMGLDAHRYLLPPSLPFLLPVAPPPLVAYAVLLHHGSAVPPPCSRRPCLCCRCLAAGGPPRPVPPWWLPRLLLCVAHICCPAALPVVQSSAPLPICSRCLRGIVLVLCAVAPPPCRPPAVAHERPLREPRGRAPAGPVRGTSPPMPRNRTGGIQKEGWVLNRALTERLFRFRNAGQICVRYIPVGLHRTSCSVAWLHRSIFREDGTERNHDNRTPIPWSGCIGGTPRGPVPSSRLFSAFHLGCIVQPACQVN